MDGHFTPASEVREGIPPILDEIINTMMAKDPIDRYQTVSELIVHLERTRLAAEVPSFVDPELAYADPVVQERLASVSQPTSPDLRGPPRTKAAKGGRAKGVETAHPNRPELSPTDSEELWYLRYPGPKGVWRTTRVTTKQVIKRLKQRKIPKGTLASQQADGPFQPITEIPAFRTPKSVSTEASGQLGDQRAEPSTQVQTNQPTQTKDNSRELNLNDNWMFYVGASVIAGILLTLIIWLLRHV